MKSMLSLLPLPSSRLGPLVLPVLLLFACAQERGAINRVQADALLADARFTYRQTYLNDLLRTSGGRLNNWGVGAQLGVEF
jgi:hypothetical protein